MLSELNHSITNLCSPSYYYLLFSVISLIIILVGDLFSTDKLFNATPFSFYFFRLFFIVLMTYILNWFCSKGYINLSWFLLVFPYIFTVLVLLFVDESKLKCMINK